MAKPQSTIHGVPIGVPSYSFPGRPLDAAIAAMNKVGLGEFEVRQGHLEPKVRGEEFRRWRLTVPLDRGPAVSFGEGAMPVKKDAVA
jgi:hypothetical protein